MVFHYMDYSCPADNYHGTTYSNSSYYSYSYNNETGNIFNMRLSGDAISGNVKPQYDSFGRITQKVVDVNINTGSDFYEYSRVDAFYEKTTYQYTERYGRQTGQIESIVKEIRKGENTSLISSVTYQFTYDQNGNITQIADESNVIQNKYYYDSLGQLIREDNRAKGYSYVYQYDDAGNITAKKRYAFTTGALGSVQYTYNYSYNDSSWGDLLTDYAWDHIEYDEIGNPIKVGYYNEEDDYWEYGYELSWSGRQLTSYAYFENYDNEGLWYDTQITFAYNADGIRTSKTVDGIEHRYYLDGSQITAEMWTQNGVEYLLYYLYDETGSPLGMQYRTSNYASGTFDFYFFEKNLQGDVVGIYNSNGVKICTYKYDAWGSCSVSMTSGISSLDRYVANIYNPFRYRGYYYDVQTGYYYLQSRYYNPNWGRFLNADDSLYSSILGFNMFAYCDNNPVNYIDPYGESGFAAALAGWASSAWGLTLVDGPFPVGDIIYAAGCAILGVACIIETCIIIDTTIDTINTVVSTVEANTDTTPDDGSSLPDESDVDVNIDHIMQNHHPDGGKGPNKDKFPKWMTGPMVEETVRQAYNNAKENFPDSLIKIQQGVRYYLEGTAEGQKIRIWIDTVKKVIETAFPKS